MNIKTTAASVAALTIVAGSAAALTSDALAKGVSAKPGSQTIVAIAVGSDNFNVLTAAVVKAGLVEALNSNGQYTVFAPTDAAFINTLGVSDEAAAITAVESMDDTTLKNILLFHVMEGRRTSTSVLAAPRYSMLNGQTLTRNTLGAAGISATDIAAKNGVVHVIDAVLMP